MSLPGEAQTDHPEDKVGSTDGAEIERQQPESKPNTGDQPSRKPRGHNAAEAIDRAAIDRADLLTSLPHSTADSMSHARGEALSHIFEAKSPVPTPAPQPAPTSDKGPLDQITDFFSITFTKISDWWKSTPIGKFVEKAKQELSKTKQKISNWWDSFSITSLLGLSPSPSTSSSTTKPASSLSAPPARPAASIPSTPSQPLTSAPAPGASPITPPSPIQSPSSKPSPHPESGRESWKALAESESRRLGIEPAFAQAVISVESGKSGLNSDGTPVIRFEPAVLNNQLISQGIREKPGVNKHGARTVAGISCEGGPAGENACFQKALQINRAAAFASISMGLPQIMGFNSKLVGYSNAEEMYNHFKSTGGGETEQIRAMFKLIEKVPVLLSAARRKDFSAFAKSYNGASPGTTAHTRYMNKLRQAYQSKK